MLGVCLGENSRLVLEKDGDCDYQGESDEVEQKTAALCCGFTAQHYQFNKDYATNTIITLLKH